MSGGRTAASLSISIPTCSGVATYRMSGAPAGVPAHAAASPIATTSAASRATLMPPPPRGEARKARVGIEVLRDQRGISADAESRERLGERLAADRLVRAVGFPVTPDVRGLPLVPDVERVDVIGADGRQDVDEGGAGAAPH